MAVGRPFRKLIAWERENFVYGTLRADRFRCQIVTSAAHRRWFLTLTSDGKTHSLERTQESLILEHHILVS